MTLLWKVSSLSCNLQFFLPTAHSINSGYHFSHLLPTVSWPHIILQLILHFWVPFLSKFLGITGMLAGSYITLSLCSALWSASGPPSLKRCSCDAAVMICPSALSLWQQITFCSWEQLLLHISFLVFLRPHLTRFLSLLYWCLFIAPTSKQMSQGLVFRSFFFFFSTCSLYDLYTIPSLYWCLSNVCFSQDVCLECLPPTWNYLSNSSLAPQKSSFRCCYHPGPRPHRFSPK